MIWRSMKMAKVLVSLVPNTSGLWRAPTKMLKHPTGFLMSWIKVSKTLDTSEFVKKLISPLQKVPHCTSTLLLPLPLKKKHSTWRCPANCHNGLWDGWPIEKKNASPSWLDITFFQGLKNWKFPVNLPKYQSLGHSIYPTLPVNPTLFKAWKNWYYTTILGERLPSQPRRTFHLAASWSGCWP